MIKNFIIYANKKFFEEKDSWLLWLVAIFTFGICFYFSLSFEPNLIFIFFICLISCACYLTTNFWFKVLASIIFAFSLGVFVPCFHAKLAGTYLLNKTIKYAKIQGIVESVNFSASGRLKLEVRLNEVIETYFINDQKNIRARDDLQGKLISFTAIKQKQEIQQGDKISFRSEIKILTNSVLPWSYDFARVSYFNKITGSGFIKSRIVICEKAKQNTYKKIINNIRQKIADIINISASKEYNGLISALLIGEQSMIPHKQNQLIKESGLSHIFAVSGMNLAIVSSICFFLIQSLFSQFSFFVENYNVRKFSALATILAAGFYLSVTGFQVSAVRAYIMISIVMIAIITDRFTMAKRIIAIAAFLMLIMSPQSIVHPGFQLSFIVTLSLISVFEDNLLKTGFEQKSFWAKNIFIKYLLANIIAALVAAFSTSIFIIYHFGSFSVWNALVNIIAAPIVSLIIMPAAFLTYLLMLFGFENWGFEIIEFGLKILLYICQLSCELLPKFSFKLPFVSIKEVFIFYVGILFISLSGGVLRLFGFFIVLISFILIFFNSRPDIIIDQKYHSLIVAGNRYFGPKRISDLYKQTWLIYTNENQINYIDPRNQEALSYKVEHKNLLFYIQGKKFGKKYLFQDLTIYDPKIKKTIYQADYKKIIKLNSCIVYIDGYEVTENCVKKTIGNRPWNILH